MQLNFLFERRKKVNPLLLYAERIFRLGSLQFRNVFDRLRSLARSLNSSRCKYSEIVIISFKNITFRKIYLKILKKKTKILIKTLTINLKFIKFCSIFIEKFCSLFIASSALLLVNFTPFCSFTHSSFLAINSLRYVDWVPHDCSYSSNAMNSFSDPRLKIIE